MKPDAILKMPCTFTVSLSERHPIHFPESCPDGVQDLTRFVYHAVVVCGDKRIAVESPAFSTDERESERAMGILQDILTYTLAGAVLTEDQKPRYTMENGVIERVQR